MKNFAMAIHGGAADKSKYIRKNSKEIKEGLTEAIQAGYTILKKGGSALDAVETSVILLEDNPFFNAGRGSALNAEGEVEMDAAIMDGKTLNAGAVSMVHSVKNPIILARTVMTKTKHVFLSGYGALKIAKKEHIIFEPSTYFITDFQYAEFQKRTNKDKLSTYLKKKNFYGTVGAVALDKKGNLAAATSTGGTSHCLPGRIGDSCVIGAGCYANNQTCAVSATGVGEYLITRVIAHTLAILSQTMSLEEACKQVIPKFKKRAGIGVISVNRQGEIGLNYNTEMMKRAWIGVDKILHVEI